jgi:two-component system, NarL family, sensor kinase
MQLQEGELYIVIILSVIGLFLLVAFVVGILYFYQQQQIKQARELEAQRKRFEEALNASLMEMKQYAMERMAEELHDGVKNELLHVNQQLFEIETTDTTWHQTIQSNTLKLTKIIEDIRNISHRLIEGKGLEDTLIDSINREAFNLTNNKRLHFTYIQEAFLNYYPEQTEIIIFRMMQEALQNAIKHAKGSDIILKVFEENDNFIIEVKDNGNGFDLQALHNNTAKKGIGLKNIYNRAQIIGASVNIISELEKGTTFTISIPIPPEE